MSFDSDLPEFSYTKPDHRGRNKSVYEAYWDDDLDKSRTGHVLPRFFGEYSKLDLVEKVVESKQTLLGIPIPPQLNDVPTTMLFPNAREEFWKAHPWEKIPSAQLPTTFHYPKKYLLQTFVDAYFNHINDFLPVLHRRTFQQNLDDELHLRDRGFGATLLVVCAIGSRYIADPRYHPGGVVDPHTAGWIWYQQVQIHRGSFLMRPTLYDLQLICLAVIFIHGFYQTDAWDMIGLGLRLCQDVGIHRRTTHFRGVLETQQWLRVFWCLICIERLASASLGLPCCIHDENIDADLLLECDDDYWVDGRPEQPSSIPSQLSYFNRFIELLQIQALALRALYSIDGSKVLIGLNSSDWQQQIVSELDSRLNQWIDSLPEHLRWNPNNPCDIFFNQSAYLHVFYYNVQILVHRPFIPSPKKPSPLAFPSLAICTNAARSSSHVIEAHNRRSGIFFAYTMYPILVSGIVLLMRIWGSKKFGVAASCASDMQDVLKCMNVLRDMEKIWRTAGRYWDLLADLVSASELSSLVKVKKHRRGESLPISLMDRVGLWRGRDEGGRDDTHREKDAANFSKRAAEKRRSYARSDETNSSSSENANASEGSSSHGEGLEDHASCITEGQQVHMRTDGSNDASSLSHPPMPRFLPYTAGSGPAIVPVDAQPSIPESQALPYPYWTPMYGSTTVPPSYYSSWDTGRPESPSNLAQAGPSIIAVNPSAGFSSPSGQSAFPSTSQSGFLNNGAPEAVPDSFVPFETPLSYTSHGDHQYDPGRNTIGNNVMNIWINAPSNFQFDEWSSFVSGMSDRS